MKKTINKMKQQSIEWEKIVANDIAHKGLISRLYKELIQLNQTNKQTNKQTLNVKNEQRPLTDIFPKKTYRWQRVIRKNAQHD